MLQDLDQRQAIGGDRNGLPDQVVPPTHPLGRRSLTPLVSMGMLLILAGGGGWAYWQWSEGSLPGFFVEYVALSNPKSAASSV